MTAKPGDPFVWSKESMKELKDYFIAFKPSGSIFMGLVESKHGNVEGASAFFRVMNCKCENYFQDHLTMFPILGELLQRTIYIDVPDFHEIVKFIFDDYKQAKIMLNESDEEEDCN